MSTTSFIIKNLGVGDGARIMSRGTETFVTRLDEENFKLLAGPVDISTDVSTVLEYLKQDPVVEVEFGETTFEEGQTKDFAKAVKTRKKLDPVYRELTEKTKVGSPNYATLRFVKHYPTYQENYTFIKDLHEKTSDLLPKQRYKEQLEKLTSSNVPRTRTLRTTRVEIPPYLTPLFEQEKTKDFPEEKTRPIISLFSERKRDPCPRKIFDSMWSDYETYGPIIACFAYLGCITENIPYSRLQEVWLDIKRKMISNVKNINDNNQMFIQASEFFKTGDDICWYGREKYNFLVNMYYYNSCNCVCSTYLMYMASRIFPTSFPVVVVQEYEHAYIGAFFYNKLYKIETTYPVYMITEANTNLIMTMTYSQQACALAFFYSHYYYYYKEEDPNKFFFGFSSGIHLFESLHEKLLYTNLAAAPCDVTSLYLMVLDHLAVISRTRPIRTLYRYFTNKLSINIEQMKTGLPNKEYTRQYVEDCHAKIMDYFRELAKHPP